MHNLHPGQVIIIKPSDGEGGGIHLNASENTRYNEVKIITKMCYNNVIKLNVENITK